MGDLESSCWGNLVWLHGSGMCRESEVHPLGHWSRSLRRSFSPSADSLWCWVCDCQSGVPGLWQQSFLSKLVEPGGCCQTSWWQLGSTTGLMGLLITFDAKACCKIAKMAMERAALELLTQPGRAGPQQAEQAHSAAWSSRKCSEVLCREASAMPKSLQVCGSTQ